MLAVVTTPEGGLKKEQLCEAICAGLWLWTIAQPLLLRTWIAGFFLLVLFAPLYLVRVLRDELRKNNNSLSTA